MIFNAISALTLTIVAAVCVQAHNIPGTLGPWKECHKDGYYPKHDYPKDGHKRDYDHKEKCEKDTTCCCVYDDYSVCYPGHKCPEYWIPPWEKCTKDDKYPCYPGYECCDGKCQPVKHDHK